MPTTINLPAYRDLLRGDLAWLSTQSGPEADHIKSLIEYELHHLPIRGHTKELKLYSVSDLTPKDLAEGACGWWLAVWAYTDLEAISLAAERYDGEAPSGADLHKILTAHNFRVADQKSGFYPDPVQTDYPAEIRYDILRKAGWYEEGEEACESCGLFAMGNDKNAVCAECYLCPGCAQFESGPTCEECEHRVEAMAAEGGV